MLRSNQSTSVLPSAGERCEFCDEFLTPRWSRFRKIYGKDVPSRIIVKEQGIVVMPSLGQLFKGSLLILPIQHFETMAEMPLEMQAAAASLIAKMESQLLPFGYPVVFEHGAKCKTGGSCGIYHAHLHIVPLPAEIHAIDVLPAFAQPAESILNAWRDMEQSNHYLLFRDTAGKTVYYEPPIKPHGVFSSQFFRRILAEYFKLDTAWNWRSYTKPEPWVLETVEWFTTNKHS